jgi:hypothetical protein
MDPPFANGHQSGINLAWLVLPHGEDFIEQLDGWSSEGALKGPSLPNLRYRP